MVTAEERLLHASIVKMSATTALSERYPQRMQAIDQAFQIAEPRRIVEGMEADQVAVDLVGLTRTSSPPPATAQRWRPRMPATQ